MFGAGFGSLIGPAVPEPPPLSATSALAVLMDANVRMAELMAAEPPHCKHRTHSFCHDCCGEAFDLKATAPFQETVVSSMVYYCANDGLQEHEAESLAEVVRFCLLAGVAPTFLQNDTLLAVASSFGVAFNERHDTVTLIVKGTNFTYRRDDDCWELVKPAAPADDRRTFAAAWPPKVGLEFPRG